MEPEWNLSVCGLNCATCDFMRAGQGDKAKQKEIIDWFKRDFDEEITPEETMCMGCRGPRETHWSPDCALRNCAIARAISSAVNSMPSAMMDTAAINRQSITSGR